VLHLSVLLCRECGFRGLEPRDIADPRKSYTRRLARLVIGLSRCMTLSDVAKHLTLGRDLVKSIVKQHLLRLEKRRSWRKVRYVAIDEFAVRKKHRYMTTVMDSDSGEVLYVAEGRDYPCLKPFFDRIRRAGAKLQTIAVDMWGGYRKAIELYAPAGVAVIHDAYHIVRDMNDVLDRIRRQEQRRLTKKGKRVLFGARYLLLQGREEISQEPDRCAELDELLDAKKLLHKAYLLKEELRLFWRQPSKDAAATYIRNWLQEAWGLKCPPLTRIANAIDSRIDRILSWYDHPISTGPLEGLNNKIKVLKRVAYGYRDFEFFRLRVLFIHEAKSKMTGA